MPDLYTVIHETEIGGRKMYGDAGGVWEEPPEDHLAYCLALQADGRPGTEGRYFIAKVTEVEDDA